MTQASSSVIRQATCIAIEGRGVLIEGPSGSGKSSLALALMDRGASLVGDDGVLIERHADMLLARPHPNTRGLMEIRNLGILPFPCIDHASIALVITLTPNAPRFIEAAEHVEISGVHVPMVQLWPDGPIPAIKVELALNSYGIAMR